MNLHLLLHEAESCDRPVRVGLIGAGKFGSMFLAQAGRTPGLHVVGVADLNPQRARDALDNVGWPTERFGAPDLATARDQRTTHVTDDTAGLIALDGLQVIVEATGDPAAGVHHATMAFAHRCHVVMVNVEADALVGPWLAQQAAAVDVVYSLAYGDQPALICEMVDWARAAGFEVTAAGKGTKYLPAYHASTPDTVWNHYGLTPSQAAEGGMNARMFNSFLDGTKSAIEMAAVANATGLSAAPDGLQFPPCDVDRLPEVLRPHGDGGVLALRGQVEVVSSLSRDGAELPHDLRWGVYTVFAAPDDYVRRCFGEYGLKTDDSGWYAAMYKPYHLIGLELGISVASVALRHEPTGCPRGWRADVVAVAKSDLAAGDLLDGEGGYTVWGRLMPAEASVHGGALPLGLARGVRMRHPVTSGCVVRTDDVELDASVEIVRVRRSMEQTFGGEPATRAVPRP